MKILDIISASCFWGRIIEHRLPFEGRSYDTNVYLTLGMDMNLHYAKASNRKQCTGAEKYDICVIKTILHGYQRFALTEECYISYTNVLSEPNLVDESAFREQNYI